MKILAGYGSGGLRPSNAALFTNHKTSTDSRLYFGARGHQPQILKILLLKNPGQETAGERGGYKGHLCLMEAMLLHWR